MTDETTPTISDVLAEKVRTYRERQGLRQEDVAARTGELGHPMSRVTLAKLEAGGTRAVNASLVDVLVLAAALDVPPPMLFLPIGEAEAVAIAPGLVTHPHLALDWLAGEAPFSEAGGPGWNVEAWGRNAQPLLFFRGLRERQDAAAAAWVAVKSWEQRGDAERAEAARRDLDRALSGLASWVEAMRAAGLSVPEMPAEYAERLHRADG